LLRADPKRGERKRRGGRTSASTTKRKTAGEGAVNLLGKKTRQEIDMLRREGRNLLPSIWKE